MSSVSRWMTYVPRFVRHWRHRRKAGYAVGHAFQSARKRMLDSDA